MLDTTAPFVPGSYTSTAAALRVEGKLGTTKEMVYDDIVRHAPTSRLEIADRLNLRSTSARLRDLELAKRIRKCGSRITARGQTEDLWETGEPMYERAQGTTPQPRQFIEWGAPSGVFQLLVYGLLMEHSKLSDDSIFNLSGMSERHRAALCGARGALIEKGVVGYCGTTIASTDYEVALWTASEDWIQHEAAERKPRKPKASKADTRPGTPYDAADSYKVGDRVTHAEHGTGTVDFVDMDGSQIEVSFPGGQRELAARVSA